VILALLLGTGVWYTFSTGAVQLRKFPHMLAVTLGALFKKQKQSKRGSLTPFQAMTTALAATAGTGNIVGVATAIASGGPGALFWMWVSAFVGMATKYAEVVLAIKYREKNATGEWVGGAMYYITNGMGKKWRFMALLFSFFGALAALGIGNIAQINSIAGSVENVAVTFGLAGASAAGTFTWLRFGCGVIVALLVGAVMLGGLRRIGRLSETLVPLMAILYLLGALAVIVVNVDGVPEALISVVRGAFSVKAAAGGVFGYTFAQAFRYGVARGVFTNEAGMGSAPTAHAAADTNSPVRQGMFGIFEVFADTIVICSLTGLAILCSGAFTGVGPSGEARLTGAPLTIAAFSTAMGSFASVFIALCVLLFAFATLLSWGLYGQRFFEYLTGSTRFTRVYQAVFLIVIVLGSYMNLELVWSVSDTLNGLMAIPNLIALLSLSGVVIRLTRDYDRQIRVLGK
jgi:AGCS family alanine or glycine:cation symporter